MESFVCPFMFTVLASWEPMNRILRNSLNIAKILSRIYSPHDGIFVCWFVNKHERWKSFSWGGGFTLKKLLRYWNETWYLCSYQCWYFDVDRKWPTVEVMVYIETLWENMFIFFRATEQTLARFGRTFPNEVWHSSHMTSDILMVNIWRFFSQRHPKGFDWIL